jgi:hypothetical protein
MPALRWPGAVLCRSVHRPGGGPRKKILAFGEDIYTKKKPERQQAAGRWPPPCCRGGRTSYKSPEVQD